MAILNPHGTTTGGHEDFNDQEHTLPRDGSGPLPSPGPQPTGTSPIGGTGATTGTRPPGWLKIFTLLLGAYNAAYLLDCIKNSRTPDPNIGDSIIRMLETQADHICARYPKEISAAVF